MKVAVKLLLTGILSVLFVWQASSTIFKFLEFRTTHKVKTKKKKKEDKVYLYKAIIFMTLFLDNIS